MFNSLIEKTKKYPTKKKPHVFFMHIPKTGGTSISDALQKQYPFNFFKVNAGSSLRAAKTVYGKDYKDFEQCYQVRSCIAAYAMEQNIKCITGHIHYSETISQQHHGKYLYVTMLRDPIERFISQYFYNFYKSSQHCKFDMELSEYLDSEIGFRIGREYVRYMSGISNITDESTNSALDKAKENISKFDFVGFLDDLNGFIQGFHEKTNIKLKIQHKNQRKGIAKKPKIDPGNLKKIEEICQPDIELFNHSKGLFK